MFQTVKEQQTFEANKEKFFSCTPEDMEERRKNLAAIAAYDPKSELKNQYRMDKTQSKKRKFCF